MPMSAMRQLMTMQLTTCTSNQDNNRSLQGSYLVCLDKDLGYTLLQRHAIRVEQIRCIM